MSNNQVGTTATPVDPISTQVEYVVKELQAILNGEVTLPSVMIAVHQGVLIMRKFSSLTGVEKKDIMSKALYLLVDRSSMSDEDKVASRMMLDMGMADTIDNLVFMASGQVKMQFSKWKCCIPFTSDPSI